MRVAIPLFGTRVSPRCLLASEVTLAEIEPSRVLTQETVPFPVADESDLVEVLLGLDAGMLVCGGIGRDLVRELEASGIDVVQNVAGEVEEVLEALGAGTLESGHGLRPGRAARCAAPPRAAELPRVDCVACAERSCAHGGACHLDVGPSGRPWLRGQEARIYETGRDVSAESDPNLCRIAELVHFARDVGYRKIGVAFCWELFQEVDTLVRVLGRFFDVVPVCCRVFAGGGGPSDAEAAETECNPVAQARVLERAEVDLNVIAGLCLGCDILFTSRSHAPVTTLFVKDRLLSHNPVGAIYTRYHLEDLERRKPGRTLARSQGMKT